MLCKKFHGFEPIFSSPRERCTSIEQVHPSPLLAAGQQNGGGEKIRQAKKHKGLRLQQKCSGVPRNAVHISHPAAAKNTANERTNANAHSPASVDVITIIVSSYRAPSPSKSSLASIDTAWRERLRGEGSRKTTLTHSLALILIYHPIQSPNHAGHAPSTERQSFASEVA